MKLEKMLVFIEYQKVIYKCNIRLVLVIRRAAEMDSKFPKGDPSKQVSAGSTTRAPGRDEMVVRLVTGSLQIISDL